MQEYPGLVPMNVNKDAKYSIKRHDGDWRVCVPYRLNDREIELLTTASHPSLVERVNDIKTAVTGTPGGAFYINEYGDVIVPADGDAYWGGWYGGVLEFALDDGTIGPAAPEGLGPGDLWPGTRVGIRYVLASKGMDIKYQLRPTPTHQITVMLSDQVGPTAAAQLAQRIAEAKGSDGGRIYINERAEFFGPPSGGGDHLYFGHLDDDDWFPSPNLPRE